MRNLPPEVGDDDRALLTVLHDAADAVATALMAWLVGHHAHLAVPGGELALVPLGLTALPVALLHAATLRAGRTAVALEVLCAGCARGAPGAARGRGAVGVGARAPLARAQPVGDERGGGAGPR